MPYKKTKRTNMAKKAGKPVGKVIKKVTTAKNKK